jgi:hypothetical protein
MNFTALFFAVFLLFGVGDRTLHGVISVTFVAGFMAGILLFFFIYEWRFDSGKGAKRWKALCKKWESESAWQRRIRGWAVLLFYLLSLAGWFCCVMQLGTQAQ